MALQAAPYSARHRLRRLRCQHEKRGWPTLQSFSVKRESRGRASEMPPGTCPQVPAQARDPALPSEAWSSGRRRPRTSANSWAQRAVKGSSPPTLVRCWSCWLSGWDRRRRS
eukprot:3721214-Rhodomonas_salina.2